jgi:heme exporter protein D
MDDWFYVWLAYAVVWGAIALYAWTLQRRIAQARTVAERMRQAAAEDISTAPQQATDAASSTSSQEDPACDAPSVPSPSASR